MTARVEFMRPGDTLPAIALPKLDGSPAVMTDFVGRRLLIFMWASW